MTRFLFRGLQFVLVFVAVLYVCDWAVLRVRMSRQTAFRTVQVDQFLATPLKGHKQEFDYLGEADQLCARSIFPHASDPPCWWVERHKTQWEQ
jgi:hypothetical protein